MGIIVADITLECWNYKKRSVSSTRQLSTLLDTGAPRILRTSNRYQKQSREKPKS